MQLLLSEGGGEQEQSCVQGRAQVTPESKLQILIILSPLQDVDWLVESED